MQTHRYYLSFLALAIAFLAEAAPARKGIIPLTQPDGSVIEARIAGDEYGHLITTNDGCAVTWGRDGYLCYVSFDQQGRQLSTGIRVGSPGSAAAAAASRNIPYNLLSHRHASLRARSDAAPVHAPLCLAPAEKSLSDNSRAIVLLAQFQDLKFKYDRQDFINLLTQKGYSYNGASGSVADYFNDQFKGTVEFVFDVGPVVTLSNGYAWYGENDDDGHDKRAAEAAAEACRLSDPDIDFAQYDNIYVFYAGANPADGSADDDHIWPHSWDLPSAGIRLCLDGKVIDKYAMSPEQVMNLSNGTVMFTPIGTFCHEYSHTLGLPDFYDTDYEDSGGETDALWGTTSLMDSGNYNNEGRTPPGYNGIELEMLGLSEPESLHPGSYVLEPLPESRRVLRMDTDTEGEYFLFECRTTSGWDKFIEGSGLLIYHIDKSARNTGYSSEFEKDLTAAERWSPDYNEINCRPDHQCADLVEAYSAAGTTSQVFFPYMSKNAFAFDTDPAFVFWSGAPSIFSLANIKKSGQAISFDVNGPISLDVKDIYQDAVILNWHSDIEFCNKFPTYVSWTDDEGEAHEVEVRPYGDGKYAYTIEGLRPSRTYCIDICYHIEDQDGYPVALEITTSPYSGLPFICMGGAPRRESASSTANRLPLRVNNARGASSVTWYFDGSEIHTGADGYYTINRAGVLKAVVDYRDGTQEIIIREVKVR